MYQCRKLIFTGIIIAGIAFSVVGQSTIELPSGTVIEKITCLKDTAQSYAAYLPSYYSKEKTWPIIYAYDAAARGKLPVELFKEAAEKYGYIVVGSNNSQNGPWEPILEAADAIFQDTNERLSIDKKRVITTGFSGGSRVASAMADLTGSIYGIIGCGAAFPESHPPHKNLTVKYIGLIGGRDFNYIEMHQLADTLDSLGIRNQLTIFESDHEWPPSDVLEEAVLLTEFHAMRDGLISKNEKIIDIFEEKTLRYINEQLRENNKIKAYYEYKKLIRGLTGLRDVSGYEEQLALSERSDILKSYFQLLKKEEEAQQKFFDAFTAIRATALYDATVQPKSWWETEIKAIRQMIADDNPQIVLSGKRLINFINVKIITGYPAAFANEKYTTALHFLDVWPFTEPKRPTPHYSKARVYTKKKMYAKAYLELERAVEKGFSRLDFLENDIHLAALRKGKRYQKIVSIIREKSLK